MWRKLRPDFSVVGYFAWDSCGNRWHDRESTVEKALETGLEEQMIVIDW
jgi:hypothetical protein